MSRISVVFITKHNFINFDFARRPYNTPRLPCRVIAAAAWTIERRYDYPEMFAPPTFLTHAATG